MTHGADDEPLDSDERDHANRELVERFFAASERGDLAALETMVDDRMVMEWPQSGERFQGRENVLGAMAAVEVRPQFAGSPRLIGSGPLWVLMVPLRYGEDVLQYVAILELERGRIRRGHRVLGRAVSGAGRSRAVHRPRLSHRSPRERRIGPVSRRSASGLHRRARPTTPRRPWSAGPRRDPMAEGRRSARCTRA